MKTVEGKKKEKMAWNVSSSHTRRQLSSNPPDYAIGRRGDDYTKRPHFSATFKATHWNRNSPFLLFLTRSYSVKEVDLNASSPKGSGGELLSLTELSFAEPQLPQDKRSFPIYSIILICQKRYTGRLVALNRTMITWTLLLMNDHHDGQTIKVTAIIITLVFLKFDFNMDLASLGIIIDFRLNVHSRLHFAPKTMQFSI